MKPYDYRNRNGIQEVSWDDFAQMAARLAEEIARANVDLVIGIARSGLFPGTLVALMLRRELYPIRLSRRLNDVVQFNKPVWRVDVPAAVRGRRVAVVDEIADTGETIALVVERCRQQGVQHVVTAALFAHSWANPRPDFVSQLSDALIIFPWDRKVLQDGRWINHPEVEAAVQAQKNRAPA